MIKGMRRLTRLSALMVFSICSFAADGPDARSIINRHLEAIGGAKAYKAIHSVRREGVLKIPAQGAELPFVLITKRPQKLHQTLTFQGNDIIQASDGKEIWGLNPLAGDTEPGQLEGELKEHVERKSWFDDLFFEIDESRSIELAYKGTLDEDDQTLHHVLVTYGDGHAENRYYSSKTGLLVKTIQNQTGPAGQIEVVSTYSNWKKAGGVLFPTKMETSTGQSVDFTKVEVNVDTPDSLFTFKK